MTLPFPKSWLLLITRHSALIAKMSVCKIEFWMIVECLREQIFLKESISADLVVFIGPF